MSQHRRAWTVALCCLLPALPVAPAAYSPQSEGAHLRAIRTLSTAELGLPGPSGLTFWPEANALVVVNAEPGAEATIALVSPSEQLLASYPLGVAAASPAAVAYDAQAQRLLLFDAGSGRLAALSAGPGSELGVPANTVDRFDASELGVKAPSGMVADPASGRLWILDGSAPSLVGIMPGARGELTSAAALAEGRLTRIDLQLSDVADLCGLALNPTDGHFFTLSPSQRRLFEFTSAGRLVGTHDLAPFAIANPQGLAFAPSGDPTDDPAISNLYIADGGGEVAAGGIVELSFTPAPALVAAVPTVHARLVRTTDMSIYDPPSPDPAGIAYLPDLDRLLISDSEVDEMTYFEKNLFQVMRTGSLRTTYSTTAFESYEPTGVAYDPVSRHLFFSDDSRRRVYELNPGPDGRPFTADDVVTYFKCSDYGSTDPEGIAYDSSRGHLLAVDGAGGEVYDIAPGANGCFDGVSPAGDDVVTHFDTTSLGIEDPEGVEFDPDNRHIYVMSSRSSLIAETTIDGTLVRYIDIAASKARMAAGLAYAPASSGSPEMNFYIVARGVDNDHDPAENDGRMYEMSLSQGYTVYLPLALR